MQVLIVDKASLRRRKLWKTRLNALTLYEVLTKFSSDLQIQASQAHS